MQTAGLQTLFTGQQTTFLKKVDSTNSYLNNLLSQHRLPEGAVIVADEQTAGRGLANERWESEAGRNLLMSVVFYPSFLSTQNLFMLSKTFSLGVYDCILGILPGFRENKTIKIKWPNDIYVGEKKICGMLIENSIRNPNINHTLLGIGLNVNQENFSQSLKNPVSLKMILGKEQRIDYCFSALCSSIERRYLQLKAGHADQLNEDYLSALFRFGELQEYESGRERFKAKLTAIADDGKIFLKHENGLIGRYDFKEVKFIV
jgi:BirA family biotin operon repressor/biotin-[acetyl-CoA-carboxylase] ligase